MNWAMIRVASWIMIKAQPDFIGNVATKEIVWEINEKNDAHKQLVVQGKKVS
jgi:hypothetical protein